MAKGKNRNRRPTVRKRDFNTITNSRRVLLSDYPTVSDYTEVDDARRYHPPTPSPRQPVSVHGTPSKYHYSSLDPIRVAFEQPEKVLVCVRRKSRKEVLHALRLTGKKGRGGSHRRTPLSDIHC